ncbi:unnamed protein product [Caenorhabditis sp. 36 PRJEB53466]|nr:unnamed protein product [Caenorhabditis sp. 36 PRJEB53466]
MHPKTSSPTTTTATVNSKEFLESKWRHAFTTFFDLDRNGIIEWKDFKDLIEVIGEVRGRRSDVFMTARLCLPDIWQKMTEAIGKEDDDIITLSDWIQLCEASRKSSREPAWQKRTWSTCSSCWMNPEIILWTRPSMCKCSDTSESTARTQATRSISLHLIIKANSSTPSTRRSSTCSGSNSSTRKTRRLPEVGS